MEEWYYLRSVNNGEYLAKNYDVTPHIHESRVFKCREDAEEYINKHVAQSFKNYWAVVPKSENPIFEVMNT